MRRAIFAVVVLVVGSMSIPALARARAAATWSAIAGPPVPVEQTSGAFAKGKIYVPGGTESDFQTYFGKMQVYSIAENSWKVDQEPMPSGPLSQSEVCTDGSKVYVMGGITQQGIIIGTMQIYDPSKPKGSRWSTGPTPSAPGKGDLTMRDGGCAWVDGKLYVFGGQIGFGGDKDRGFTWVFDPGTQTWSNTGLTMKVAAASFGYASNGKVIYVVGGEANTGKPLRGAERFTPKGGWVAIASIPTPAGAQAGTGLGGPGLGFLAGKLAVFGGNSMGTGAQSTTLVCSLPCGPSSTWSNAHKDLKQARSFFPWASGGSTPTLYAISGIGSLTVLTTAEKTT